MSRLTQVGLAGPGSGMPVVRTLVERTCVGCRERSGVADLLRVVVVDEAVVPDPRRRLPGRGASLHPRAECLALALRRRAFPRALRVQGPLDSTALEEFLREQHEEQ